MTPPLDVRGLSVTYPNGLRALDGVDLRVEAGQRVGLVGRSGSGKTTLVRAVLGLLPPGATVTGQVLVDGRDVLGLGESELRSLRGRAVGYVPQDPFAAFDPLRTVRHHVLEAWTAHRDRPPVDACARLSGVGIAEQRAAQHPHRWSGGMLQRATLVAATAYAPALVLADEPTSALDTELADDVLEEIVRVCGAVLVISHDLALVARHTDAVHVLDAGQLVEAGPAAHLLTTPAEERTRALVAASAPAPRTRTAAPSVPVAEAVGVSRTYRDRQVTTAAVADVSLTIGAGEIVGVVGRSGSGKSTLARLVGGMERPDAGLVRLAGHDAWDGPAQRPGYVMPVFQDPVSGLDRRWPLWRILAEPARGRGARPSRREARDRAAELLDRVGLAGIGVDRRPGSLSVGQAQRVGIARALAADPALLVADEPTSSLDVIAATAITALLREIADAGTAVLVVSHDRPRLRAYADRIVTMIDGRLEGEGRP